jgi:hypothetical protein
MVLLLPLGLFAQTLTSVSPAKFYTQSEPTTMSLTINGKNMWPNNLTITMAGQVMHVHFKKNGKEEIIKRYLISSTSHDVRFTSTDWVSTAGPVEVFVTIDAFSGNPAYRSNSLWLQVEETPKQAPVLTSLSKTALNTGLKRDSYYIRLYGKNFGETRSTYATFGGLNASVGWQHLEDGVIDIWIPTEVINKPGSYPVVVHTKYGTSNPIDFKIDQPVAQVNTVGKVQNVKIQPVATKPVLNVGNNNSAVQVSNVSVMSNDKQAKLAAQVIKGVRVTITGVTADGPTSTTLERFISEQDNVFVVDNQLQILETNGNINIVLKPNGIDETTVNNLKKSIEDKAASLKLTVAVTKQ